MIRIEIKIKRLQGDHKSRSMKIYSGVHRITTPYRVLNKREIDKFRKPNYIPGQENWNQGVLPHDAVEYTVDLYSKNYYRFKEDEYFKNQINKINKKLEGYERKFKLFVPRVDPNYINLMDNDDVFYLIALQHQLGLKIVHVPDIKYRGSVPNFIYNMEYCRKLNLVNDNDLMIVPTLYLEEPQKTLLPKVEWLLRNDFNGITFLYKSGKQGTQAKIYEEIADKDVVVHMSNVKNDITLKKKKIRKDVSRIHLVPSIIGDSFSGYITAYRPDRKPLDEFTFKNVNRSQAEQKGRKFRRFDSTSLGIHQKSEHKIVIGNQIMNCNCPMCLGKDIDQVIQLLNRLTSNQQYAANVVHETYESHQEFLNFQNEMNSDTDLTYMEYLEEKNYLQDVLDKIPGAKNAEKIKNSLHKKDRSIIGNEGNKQSKLNDFF